MSRPIVIVTAAGSEPVRIESKEPASWDDLQKAHAAFDAVELLREAERANDEHQTRLRGARRTAAGN